MRPHEALRAITNCRVRVSVSGRSVGPGSEFDTGRPHSVNKIAIDIDENVVVLLGVFPVETVNVSQRKACIGY